MAQQNLAQSNPSPQSGSERLAAFVAALESAQRERFLREYTHVGPPAVTVKPGAKYTKVDVGNSGKYMIVNATGEIFGIKAYGVIHRGHYFGTLDTIGEWDWSGYAGVRKVAR